MPYRVVATEIIDEQDRVVFNALDTKIIRRELCRRWNEAEAAEARAAMLQEALGPNARILNQRRDEQIKQLTAERDELARKLEQAQIEKWRTIDALRNIVNDITNYPGLFNADSESVIRARKFLDSALVDKVQP